MQMLGFIEPKRLAESLQLSPGIISLVGGGGKTSVMMALAKSLSMRGSVIVTTTTHIYEPNDIRVLLDPTVEMIREAFLNGDQMICIGKRARDGKLTSADVPLELLKEIADYVLVEADGAKQLPLKAPAEHEPVVPQSTSTVIAVAGLDGIGKPICDTAFRPELYASILDRSVDHIVTEKDLAAVLTHTMGQRKNVPKTARYCIILNKADTAEQEFSAQIVTQNITQAAVYMIGWTSFRRE